MRNWIHSNSVALKLFAAVWLVYACYVTPAGGVLPNRYQDLAFSIVNEGRFTIDTYHANTIDKAFYQGHYYLVALPGPAFLMIPAYLVFKPIYAMIPASLKEMASGVQSFKKEPLADSGFYGQVDNTEFFLFQMFMTLVLQGGISALGAVFVMKVAERMGARVNHALLVAILYAFGTIVFFFSTVYFEQVLSATVTVSSFYLVLCATRAEGNVKSAPIVFSAGLVAGFGLLVEYPAIFLALCLAFWLIINRELKLLWHFGIGFALPTLILLAYNQAIFGFPIATAYTYIDVAQQKNHLEGFLGMSYPRFDRMIALLIGTERGLFLYAPIALLGFIGLIANICRRVHVRESIVCLSIVFISVLFFASISDWKAGASFGPRYLIPILPLIMIGVASLIDSSQHWLSYGIGAVSICINWLGAQFGFADSPWQHLNTLITQGPTLPIFGAILSHSTSQSSMLYLFALNYHVPMTVGVSLGLILLFIWLSRDVWSAESNSQRI